MPHRAAPLACAGPVSAPPPLHLCAGLFFVLAEIHLRHACSFLKRDIEGVVGTAPGPRALSPRRARSSSDKWRGGHGVRSWCQASGVAAPEGGASQIYAHSSAASSALPPPWRALPAHHQATTARRLRQTHVVWREVTARAAPRRCWQLPGSSARKPAKSVARRASAAWLSPTISSRSRRGR
jgi:hypothetical protein